MVGGNENGSKITAQAVSCFSLPGKSVTSLATEKKEEELNYFYRGSETIDDG